MRPFKDIFGKVLPDDVVNQQILGFRSSIHMGKTYPQVGDFVKFDDGPTRRISYVWKYSDEEDPKEWFIQTSEIHRSYYLGHGGHISYSGGLYQAFQANVLELADYTKSGTVWIFNRGIAKAHNGVDLECKFKVWYAHCEAPSI